MTRDEALEVVARICAAYNRDLPPETVAVWLDHLRDVNAEAAGIALGELIRGAERMPSIAEFRKQARAVKTRLDNKAWNALPPVTAQDKVTALSFIREMREKLQHAG
jgi:hypothetical protein